MRAWERSRWAWKTKKLVSMPAANFFSAASSRRSASERAARVLSTRFWFVWTVRAASLNASQAVMKKDAWRRFAHMKLDDDDLRVRLAAARLLDDDAAAIAIFTEALGNDDTRLGAAIDLARLEDPRGLATLGELVVSPDPATRRGAAAGYQQAHHLDGGLVPALADDDPLIRILAAGAILAM